MKKKLSNVIFSIILLISVLGNSVYASEPGNGEVPVIALEAVTAANQLFNPRVSVLGPNDPRLDSMLQAITYQSNTDRTTVDKIYGLIYTSAFRPKEMGGARFPYTNNNGYVYYVSDGQYGYSINGAAGCMAYCNWVSKHLFGRDRNATVYEGEAAGRMTAGGLKYFIQTFLQAGEHIRIDWTHSLSFVSCTEEGFYYLNYNNDNYPYISLNFPTSETGANA